MFMVHLNEGNLSLYRSAVEAFDLKPSRLHCYHAVSNLLSFWGWRTQSWKHIGQTWSVSFHHAVLAENTASLLDQMTTHGNKNICISIFIVYGIIMPVSLDNRRQLYIVINIIQYLHHSVLCTVPWKQLIDANCHCANFEDYRLLVIIANNREYHKIDVKYDDNIGVMSKNRGVTSFSTKITVSWW